MEEQLCDFPFSKSFNYLYFVGGWNLKTDNFILDRLYFLYQVLCQWALFASIMFQLIDLYQVFGSLEKMTFNMSTSVIVIGTTAKLILLLTKTDAIDRLRLNLWRDYYKFHEIEDDDIKRATVKEMEFVAKVFHVGVFIFYPLWMILAYFSYLWGPRELPFPAFLPINYNESIPYIICFAIEGVGGTIVLVGIIETNLITFSIILQLSAQYKILGKNLQKLNDLYPDEDQGTRVEFNSALKRHRTEKLLKELINRQLVLGKYAQDFESGFNSAFLLQVLSGSTLIIMNGLQVIKMTYHFSGKIAYQLGYLFLIIIDIFYNYLYTTMLISEFKNIGFAAYSTAWYKMDARLQKYLLMMIIQAQKVPRITAGKLYVVNLESFLGLLKNTYSWLMLFRQFEK